MSKFSALAPVALFVAGGGAVKTAVAVITIAAALVGGSLHSGAYADGPTGTRASQAPADASQALRRYTLRMLQLLSDDDVNEWTRYWQARSHCDVPPARLDEPIDDSNASRLDAALTSLNDALCGDLERRLAVNPGDYLPSDEIRTVGLLVNEPEAMHGYLLIPGRFSNRIDLIDHLGRIINTWSFGNWAMHARLLDNGNILAETRHGGGVTSIAELDPDNNIVWSYTLDGGRIHHDFIKMPNGNVLMLLVDHKTREEAIAAGINPDILHSETMQHDLLIELHPMGSEGGEIVWEWNAWDYIVQDFDPSKPNYGDPSEHPELIDINLPSPEGPLFTNINGMDYNPELDQIALSDRAHSELWIIDHSASTEEAPTRKGGNAGKGGALLYRWGNSHAYGHGTVADRRLFRQHHTQWIAPGLPGAGNMLIFNNGFAQEDQLRGYSSIEEIVPPMDGYGYRHESGAPYPPADPIWTYTAETSTDFYSPVMGGVQRLPNGNTLICAATSGEVFQVTPDGKTVWKYVYPMNPFTRLKQGEKVTKYPRLAPRGGQSVLNNAVYRAYWYAPDHPGLQKYELTPGDTLEIYE